MTGSDTHAEAAYKDDLPTMRIGGAATLAIAADGIQEPIREREVLDLQSAVEWIFEHLGQQTVDMMGHRIVHGGAWFREAVIMDDAVSDKSALVTDLAPLHNRACLATIKAARAVVGTHIPMIAVFDAVYATAVDEETWIAREILRCLQDQEGGQR